MKTLCMGSGAMRPAMQTLYGFWSNETGYADTVWVLEQ